MRQQLVIFLLAAILMGPFLLGQSTQNPKAWGYGFAGFGTTITGWDDEGLLHLGGGGEGLVAEGLALGATLGYMAPFSSLKDGFGVFSPGAAYVFNRDRKVNPFVCGGYSLLFRSDTAHGAFFGGGVNYWAKDRWGLRFEGRNHWVSQGANVNLLEFRVGFLFR